MFAGRVGLLVVGVIGLVFAAADPVVADEDDDIDTTVTFLVSSGTSTTFAILSGPLSVSAPEPVDLGTAGPSSSITSPLGTVTVTDMRALLAPTWTVTVSSTGGGMTGETIAATGVTYWSGLDTASSGAGAVFVPGQPAASDQVAISTSRTAFSLSSGLGNNSVSWNPTLSVTIPEAAVSGECTATVTHSAA
ncbi:hypothetical protein ABZ345_45415 [Lentzea sp. NPDC005914]|uniref:hypothetical protein n=1 Tax=Lentzea sp. NPDC005914 TaxID=3154572 RepID=UPI0033D19C84